MPRLKSVVNGVTVEVSEETAGLLGSEWVAPGDVKASPRSKKSE